MILKSILNLLMKIITIGLALLGALVMSNSLVATFKGQIITGPFGVIFGLLLMPMPGLASRLGLKRHVYLAIRCGILVAWFILIILISLFFDSFKSLSTELTPVQNWSNSLNEETTVKQAETGLLNLGIIGKKTAHLKAELEVSGFECHQSESEINQLICRKSNGLTLFVGRVWIVILEISQDTISGIKISTGLIGP